MDSHYLHTIKVNLNALALFNVNVFSTKLLIGDTIFTSPSGDGTAILRGYPSQAKVSPLAVQRKCLHFSVILRPLVMVRPRESNPRPPALQSNALPTELILPRLNKSKSKIDVLVLTIDPKNEILSMLVMVKSTVQLLPEILQLLYIINCILIRPKKQIAAICKSSFSAF